MITIYHNPRCGKSRTCVMHFDALNVPYTVVRYLEHPLTEAELKKVLNLLAIRPIDLVRTKEKIWIEQFQNKIMSDDAIIQAMVLYPILIERPIVINNDKAVIARPLERIQEIL